MAPAVLATLAGCGASSSAPEALLTAGTYVADITYDQNAAPIGIHFEVLPDRRIRVVDPSFFRFPADTTRVMTERDTVRFSLRTGGRSRSCALIAAGPDGALAGTCDNGASVWTLRIWPGHAAPVPRGLSAGLLERGLGTWRSAAENRVNVHTFPDAPFAPADFLAVADSLVAANRRWLGVAADDAPLDLFLVKDRGDVARFSGRSVGGWADAYGTGVIVPGFGELRTVVQHELMHVQSHRVWGPPWGGRGWLREAVAVAATGTCAGWGFQAIASRLQADGALLPLPMLAEHFEQQDDLIAYLQAGALAEFIHGEHGTNAMEALWRSGSDGLREATGLSLEAVYVAWLSTLPTHSEAAALIDVDAGIRRTGRGCG